MHVSEANALWLAQLAPLPAPMVEQLLRGKRLTGLDRPRSRRAFTTQEWQALLQDILSLRERLYHIMTPIVRANLLSTDWLRYGVAIVRFGMAQQSFDLLEQLFAQLNEATLAGQKLSQRMTIRPIAGATFNDWRTKGLVPYTGWNRPIHHAAAALLLASGVAERQTTFLPASMTEDEWIWYCLRLDGPLTDPIPCRLTLEEPLPCVTLSDDEEQPPLPPPTSAYFSYWAGSSWSNLWLRMGGKGAVRWYEGTLDEDHTIIWVVTPEGLERWDQEAVQHYRLVLDETINILNTFGELTLKRLAKKRFLTN